MPWDCGFLCLLTDRRRYCEILWRHRLLITNDERKAKRRFLNLMRGFDSEDLQALRKAIESGGYDIKQCAPGPPMDLVEDTFEDENEMFLRHHQPTTSAGCSTTVMSSRPRHSINRLERDRIKFQRQKFPELSTQISHSNEPLELSNTASGHYVKNNYRNSSNFNSSYAYDDNVGSVWKTENDLNDYMRKSSTSYQFNNREFCEIDDNVNSYNLNEDLGLIPQIDRPMSMPYLCCKIWRWKDLQVDAALHRLDPLPWCRFGRVTINNATVSCCNPYHYGLWIKPDSFFLSENSPSLTSAENLQNFTDASFTDKMHSTVTLDNTFATDTNLNDSNKHESAIDDKKCINENENNTFNCVRTLLKNVEHHFKGSNNNNNYSPPNLSPPIPSIKKGNDKNKMCNYLSNMKQNNMSTVHSINLKSQILAWGKMARWEKKQKVGDVVALFGQFVAVGKLAGTVYDGQDIKSNWDLENETSFSLIKQSDNANFEDVWLYNSGNRPLFICVSKTLHKNPGLDTIRRLSPGYCIRVHRIPIVPVVDIPFPLSPTIGNGSSGGNVTEYNAAAAGLTTTTTLIGNAGSIIATATKNKNKEIATGTIKLQQNSTLSSKTVAFLTISVGMGWGINYQKLYVSDVPCRYEIIFMQN